MLTLIIVLSFSCAQQKVNHQVYSVLFDTTDPLLATPDTDALWGYMEAENIEKHLIMRYSFISDVDINIVQQLERSGSKKGLFSNAIQEKKRLDEFKETFHSVLSKKDSIGSPHSAIFRPILSEMKNLAAIPIGRKMELIVFSNLMENSDLASFYSSKDLWLLEHNPNELIERYLEQARDVLEVEKIHLTIVYIPKNTLENKRYQQLRFIYTKVFEQLGVPITFTGNLTKATVVR